MLGLSSLLLAAVHFFDGYELREKPGDIKQRLLDEVAAARIALSEAQAHTPTIANRKTHIFVFKGAKEICWPDNRTPVSDTLISLPPGFIQLDGGIFLFHRRKGNGDTAFVFLKLIQETARIKNKYIKPYSMFHGELALSPQAGMESINLGPQTVYYKSQAIQASNFELFSPEYYASSSRNPNLAFLLANLLFFGAVMFCFSELVQRYLKSLAFPVVAGFILLSSAVCVNVITSLISDSKLNTEFFNFNGLSAIDLVIPLILLWFGLMFFELEHNLRRVFQKKRALLVLGTLIVLFNIIRFYQDKFDLIEINWALPLLFTPFIPHSYNRAFLSWTNLVATLTLTFGWYFCLNKHLNYQVQSELELISDKLAANDDPIAEYLISEATPVLEKKYVSNSDEIGPISYLEENLFLGYLSRYSALPVADSTNNTGLFTFKFGDTHYRLIIKYNSTGFGFPELLANREFANYYEKGFSTARYNGGRLFQSGGSFVYKKQLPSAFYRNGLVVYGDHVHFARKVSDEIILVSHPQKGVLHHFATVAYLFLITLLASVPWLNKRKDRFTNLQGRIQLSLLSLVGLTVIIIGGSTYMYISDQFTEKSQLSLSEKIRSVEAELLSRTRFNGNQDPAATEIILKRLSEIFFTDISLYNTSGQLIASSQPDIFTKGVLTREMEPEAFEKMKEGSNLFIQNENIGELSYLSAYRPVSDVNNRTIGYLNLPYFAKQVELNNQLSNFLVSAITALILLSALALAVAILLAARITVPLKTIQNKLKRIDLKGAYHSIDYPYEDEIGQLVSAYNDKVYELIQKANQLAQSERESAWREMAKQVAHEIKNPLTPIKLNAQLLQRALDSDDPEIKERTRRFIAGLIDQVNTLAKIANEFSNYASLPKAVESEVDLAEVVENSVAVMAYDDVHIETRMNSRPHVKADKDLLLRVINNIVKNAIQAIGEKSSDEGKVVITLDSDEKEAKISIADNGSGVPEEMKDKIFQPNFTTKSTGMGLGLAMVKQILEQAGGSISFESRVGEGTTFFISLPLL